MSVVDANTLKWVKSEIDETLKQAQVSLEAYVEDTADESQMRFCINYLHQVSGSLIMLELGGAALLGEEIELLAKSIDKNKKLRNEECFEVLMRALIQLPDYLERLQRGSRDIPVVLLPILNDLRAARSASLFTEASVFSVDINPDEIIVGADNGVNPRALAKKARQFFQVSLLAWYKNSKDINNLRKVHKVVSKLRESCKTVDLYQLFYLMETFIEGLLTQGIKASAPTKQLVSQIDHYLKQLIVSGESTQNYTLADISLLQTLKKSLLFHIAHCTTKSKNIERTCG